MRMLRQHGRLASFSAEGKLGHKQTIILNNVVGFSSFLKLIDFSETSAG